MPDVKSTTDSELAMRLQRRVKRMRRLLDRTRLELDACRVALAGASHAATCDTLTGLPNRNGFERPLRETLAEHADGAQVLALLFIDLDGFKAVNDQLGHAVGDQLLRVVAARLAAGMRRGDHVCGQGGDEFLCLLPHLADPTRAGQIAAALQRSIAQPCRIGPHEVHVSASIGIAMFPRHGDSAPSLISSADAAMYAAKRRPGGVALARPHKAGS